MIDGLEASSTLYAVANLLIQSGMEASRFFFTEEEAISYGINMNYSRFIN